MITSARLNKVSGKMFASKATRRALEPPTSDLKQSLFQKLKRIKKGKEECLNT